MTRCRRPPGPRPRRPSARSPTARAAPDASAIHLAENDIGGSPHGRNVGKLVSATEEVHRLKVRVTRSADLAAIRLCWCHRRPDRRRTRPWAPRPRAVDLPGRHVIALGIELEVMDQRLHRPLSSRRASAARSCRRARRPDRFLASAEQTVDALAHDTRRLRISIMRMR